MKGTLVIGFLFSALFLNAEDQKVAEQSTQEKAVKKLEDLPQEVAIKSKTIDDFYAVWRRIEGNITLRYDKDEYPEVAKLTTKITKLKTRAQDVKRVVLKDKEVQKLVAAWDDVELLLLSSPRSEIQVIRAGTKAIAPIDARDIAKARKFIAQIKTRFNDVKMYRLFCAGAVSDQINQILSILINIQGDIGDCDTDDADPLDCTYANVTDLMNDINALCPIVTLLRTILAELRGVGPGPAFCP